MCIQNTAYSRWPKDGVTGNAAPIYKNKYQPILSRFSTADLSMYICIETDNVVC